MRLWSQTLCPRFRSVLQPAPCPFPVDCHPPSPTVMQGDAEHLVSLGQTQDSYGQSHEKSFKKLPYLCFPSDSKPHGNRHESPWISLILSHSWVRWRGTTFRDALASIAACRHTPSSPISTVQGKDAGMGTGCVPDLYSGAQCPCRSTTCHVLVPTWDPTVVWAGHAKLQLGYVVLMKSLQADSSISWLTAQESPAPILKETGMF